MPRSLVLVACLALALSLSAAEIPSPKSTESWVALETEGFRFVSSVSAQQTRRIARDLLRMRAAVGNVSDFRLRTAEPTRVIIFPTATRFAPYCEALLQRKCTQIGGFLSGAGNDQFIVMRADSERGVDRVVYHELTHRLVVNTNTRLPLWFHEGLAEYFSTFRTVKEQTHIGDPVDEHVQWLADERYGPLTKRLIPLRELFAVTSSSSIFNEAKRTGVFYAQSWALVHYLLHDADRRVKLTRFLGLLDDGTAVDEAFTTAFGTSFAAMEEALRAYIRGASFTVYAYDFGKLPIPELSEPAAMPHHAVLHQLGRLLAHDPQTAATAERFYKESLAANAKNAVAHADLGRLYAAMGRAQAADAAIAKAVQLAGDDPEAYVLAGRGILERGVVAEFAKARPLFTRATELDPQSAAAWVGLGTTYLTDVGNRAAGIAALEKSLELEPANEDAAYYLAQFLMDDGRNHRRVRRLAQDLLARTTNERLKTELVSLIAMTSVNHAAEKANAGSWEEALTLVEGALPNIRDEHARKQAVMIRDMIAAEVKKRK